MREHELSDWRGALTTARLAPNTGMVQLNSSTLIAAEARMEELHSALKEMRDRIKNHPVYADLTEDEEQDIGGDTAELSFLARVADAALGA